MNNNIPTNYKPLSPWSYFGYNIMFSIPIIGFVLIIIFSFDNSNINRRNYARSFWCLYMLIIIVAILLIALNISISNMIDLTTI